MNAAECFLQTRMDENRVMKEFRSVKKNLGHHISHDGHWSARDKDRSTEGV